MRPQNTSTRREFISTTAAAAGTALLASGTTLAQTQQTTPQPSRTRQRKDRPNILILCMDQWQMHMQLPRDVEFPAMRRLESQGVSFDRQYCTVPICPPSRATMWTGVHAKHTGLWDNTNFAWIGELRRDIPTIGHLLREHGYYTSFKGKWRLSPLPHTEDALEPHGFSDYQQWDDIYDLEDDPGELENLAYADHPRHDRALVAHMLGKLHELVAREIGDDLAPFDLDLFGTRDVKYQTQPRGGAPTR